MTANDSHEPAEIELMLPGLEIAAEYGARPSALRESVVTTLKALADERLLEPRHTALAQLAIELAEAVTAGRRSGRASAAAMAAAQLRETLLALPQPATLDQQARFDAFVQELRGVNAA